MLRKRYTWLAVIVIVAIAIVLIAPSVDLAPTALRAWQAACAIFLGMAAMLHVAAERAGQPPQLFSAIHPMPLMLSRTTGTLSCVLLC